MGAPNTVSMVRIVNVGNIALTVGSIGVPPPVAKATNTTKKRGKVAVMVKASGPITASTTCAGRRLQAQEGCDVVITSTNATPGARAQVIRAISTLGTIADLPITGRVLRRGLATSGPIQLGLLDRAAPKAGSTVIRNAGELPVAITSVALAGPVTSGIRVKTDGCRGVTLQVGAKCTVTVEGILDQQPPGPLKDRILVVGTEAEHAEADVLARSPLRKIVIEPAKIEFGNVVAGGKSDRKALVRNVGDLPVTVNAVALSGAPVDVFRTAVPPPCVGKTLAPKATCAIALSSVPVVLGDQNGRLTVTGAAGESVVAVLHVRLSPVVTSVEIATTAPPTTAAPVVVTVPPCPAAVLRFPVTIGPEGRPAAFVGDGFPANATVQVGWIGERPIGIATNATGHLAGSIVVLPNQQLGARTLQASVSVAGADCKPVLATYLVTLSTASPPRRNGGPAPVFR